MFSKCSSTHFRSPTSCCSSGCMRLRRKTASHSQSVSWMDLADVLSSLSSTDSEYPSSCSTVSHRRAFSPCPPRAVSTVADSAMVRFSSGRSSARISRAFVASQKAAAPLLSSPSLGMSLSVE